MVQRLIADTAPVSLAAQAKLRAAQAVSKGTVGDGGPVRITVVPASFKGKDGSIVAGVRVGRHFLVPEHVDAICEALGVTPDPEAYMKLFA
jgi:hypothetical protein